MSSSSRLHLSVRTGKIKGTQHVEQWSYGSKKNQNKLMVEINSKSLVRATGKIICMKCS